jgi:hypothetical protein
MRYFIAGKEVVLGDVEGRMGWVFKDTGEAVTINDTEKEKADVQRVRRCVPRKGDGDKPE